MAENIDTPKYLSGWRMREVAEMAGAHCAMKAGGSMLVSCVSLVSNKARCY